MFSIKIKYGLEIGYEVLRNDVYCHCHMPDNGSMMIMCEQCKEWFHKHALVKKYWRMLKDGNTCARTV